VRIGAETYEPLPPFLVAIALYVPIVYALVSLQRRRRRQATAEVAYDPRFGDRLERTFAASEAGSPKHHQLSTLAAIAALALGVVLAPALMSRQRFGSATARTFVDGMRCIPFLLFAYIIYYGPAVARLRFDNWSSGLIALIIYTPPIWRNPARRLEGATAPSRSKPEWHSAF